MSANLVVMLVVAAIFLFVIVRLIFKSGKRGGSDYVGTDGGTSYSSSDSGTYSFYDSGNASPSSFEGGGGDFGGGGADGSWDSGGSDSGGGDSGGGGDGGGGGGD